MVAVCLSAVGFTISILYNAALDGERDRLFETVRSYAQLIEAIAAFDSKYSKDYPGGPFAATISQIKDAHRNLKGFGETGEFTLARREGNEIIFILSHRHYDLNQPKPVSLDANLAIPMKLALSGKSGTVIGLDYRGETVLAAYEPVTKLNLGIVAKIDLKEIRAPFFKAMGYSMGFTIVIILFGVVLFIRLSAPIINRLSAQNKKLLKEVEKRQKTEEMLRKNESFLATLLEAIPIPVYYKDSNGLYLGCNQAFETLVGTTSKEMLNKSAFDINPEELAAVYHTKDQALFDSGGIQTYQYRIQNRAGETRDVIFHKAAFKDSNDQVAGLVGAIVDITDEKRAKSERQEREQLLNEMGEIAKIGGWEHDLVTGKAKWTKEIYNIIGIDPADPVPGPDEHLDYYPEEDRKILETAYDDAIENGKAFDLELRCKTARGKLFWARAIGRPEFKNNHCVKIKGTFQDISEKKLWEERIHKSQQLEAIGNLAGGVAHDYNNMLSVILGNVSFALEKVSPEDELFIDLKEIQDAAERSESITRQLLAFARKQIASPKVLDLNKSIQNMIKMLTRLMGEDIELRWNPCKDIWHTRIDPVQIDQILANLCINARDAIGDVGKVTIETNNTSFDDQYCADHPGFLPGNYVMIAVSDDGHGMTEETMNKIFEPFFSTKHLHKGTGLGLATVYGIVKQNNGFINVYSEPENGTTFKIYLPRDLGEVAPETAERSGRLPLGAGETILFVEDDRSILKFAEKLLKDIGYQVLSASLPSQALKTAEAHGSTISLLITDVVMPEMNGRELSEKCRAFCPEIKTLFMSGYTANVIAHRGILDDEVFFIAKPFSKEGMAKKIREVMDSPGPERPAADSL